ETLALWRHWHHKLRRQLDRFDNLASVRKPWLDLAFAAQESLPEETGWLFIAGSTEWKLSDAAASVMQRAYRRLAMHPCDHHKFIQFPTLLAATAMQIAMS